MTVQNQTSSPAAEQDIHCPLCDYNLRGLAEARCPECGGQFSWDELRDPAKRLHPYLFEHHPERNLWSFWKTAINGIMPRRFWATLNPVQPSNPRRLVFYFMIYAIAASLSVVVDYANDCQLLYLQTLSTRSQLQAQIKASLMFGAVDNFSNRILQQYGSLDKYLDVIEPLPPSIGFFKEAAGFRSYMSFYRRGWMETSLPRNAPFLMLAWLWPLTAALTLMMLRATMRRAKVRAAHLFRVTIYTADVMIWLGLCQLAIDVVWLARGLTATTPLMPGTPSPRWMGISSLFGGIGTLIAMLMMMYRLTIAIRKYLRFRHAAATAFAVQMIFALVVAKLMFVFAGY